MNCTRCGATAQPGQRFCGQCGNPLASGCPECGHENPPDHLFCGACGTQLGGEQTGAAPTASRPTERRVVTVLFIDLVGFTAFSEHRDPEDVRALITEYFDVAREVIGRFGGTVDKFIGDAVMAWWGATTSREDDAERAVRASLELVDQVRSLGERLEITALKARAGVMTGEVSVGPGGNESGLLLGDLVNATSRMQSVAEPDTVYVGETTASLIERAIEVAPGGTHQVKGREEPIVAFRVLRVLSERGGRGRADIIEPPFVGRVSELRLLKDALHGSGRDGRARLVSLVGQAGIGKSRLVWEFQKYVDGLIDDVFWHEGRSPAYGEGLALWALGEMIRRRAGIGEGDADEDTAERLAESVEAHVEDTDDRQWVLHRLSALLGIGDSVGVERTELFAAARTFFEGISRKGTVVLVFEDLHWADPSLLEFIEELPDWSQNHPILVVTMSRPDLLDRRPDWGSGRRGFASMYLAPLTDDEMTELIEGAVPGIPVHATAPIVEAAGGVPLFGVEMIRMLLGDGRLIIGEDGVEVVDELDALEVPSSVHAIISARLDRLPEGEAHLARDAAVLGQSFTLESLGALQDEEIDKLERRLADMVRHEIVEIVRDPRSPERGHYRWVQSVLREVAYARIARQDRRELHLRAARWLRDVDDPELAPKAASHYLSAVENGPRDPAIDREVVEAIRSAIARSQSIHAHEQILSLLEAALPLVPPHTEIELREIGALAASRLNDIDTADLHTDALMQIASRSDDEALLHRAVALFGLIANETRRQHRSIDVMAAHIESHPDLLADPNLARIAVYLARAHLLQGDTDRAASMGDEALAAVEHFDLVDDVADAMVTRGTALAFTRNHQAMALLRGALRICEEHDLVATKMRALTNIAYSAPEFAESIAASFQAFEEAKRVGNRNQATFVAHNLAGGLLFRLDLGTAEKVLSDPVLARGPSDRLSELGYSAQLLALRGDFDGADALLAEAGRLLDEIPDPQSRLTVERSAAFRATLGLDFETGFEIAERHIRETLFAPGISISIALENAALQGHEARLRHLLELTRGLPSGGDRSYPLIRWDEALLTLFEGDAHAAISQTDALLDDLRALDFAWWEFLVASSFAKHLPAGHQASEVYLRRAHGIAADTDAHGLLQFLGAFMDRS